MSHNLILWVLAISFMENDLFCSMSNELFNCGNVEDPPGRFMWDLNPAPFRMMKPL